MKKVLFATTATAALALGGMASAQGITLFGDARLGLGYNINNGGGVTLEESNSETELVDTGAVDINGDPIFADETVITEYDGTDDARAVSRVRFGVNMTGETDSGISFGATIRADNSNGGNNSLGQTAGEVFVSGDWGTLTFGDTNGADEQHVGDAVGNLSLTGLGDFNETPFISNGGGFGDDSFNFANNPNARPTVRYDYDIAGFGISVSTNRDLNDIVVGAGYTYDFGGASFTGGIGYNDFQSFTTSPTTTAPGGIFVRGGEQFSVGFSGDFELFNAGVVYTNADASGVGTLETLTVGGGATFGAWGVSAYYVDVLDASSDAGSALNVFESVDSYGASVAYDLGGGASFNAGIAQTFGRNSLGDPFIDNGAGDLIVNDGFVSSVDSVTVADFGIKMSF